MYPVSFPRCVDSKWLPKSVASAHTLRLAAVSRWVSSARGQPLDGRLRKASSPTYSFRISIRIYLFLLTKTLNSKAERTDVFVRNCKTKKFTQLLFVLIECIYYCLSPHFNHKLLTINSFLLFLLKAQGSRLMASLSSLTINYQL